MNLYLVRRAPAGASTASQRAGSLVNLGLLVRATATVVEVANLGTVEDRLV